MRFRERRRTSTDELLAPHHLNPDHIRWKLHRVWIVEAKLAGQCRIIEVVSTGSRSRPASHDVADVELAPRIWEQED